MDIQESKIIGQSFVQDADQYGKEHHVEYASWLSSVWTWIKYQIFYVITNWSAASKAEKIFKEVQTTTFNADYFCHASRAVLESFKNKCIDPEARVAHGDLAKCIEQLYIAWNRARYETTKKYIEDVGSTLCSCLKPLPILSSISEKSCDLEPGNDNTFPEVDKIPTEPPVSKSSSSSESEETHEPTVVAGEHKKTKAQKVKSALQRVSEKLLRKESIDQKILHQQEKIENYKKAIKEAEDDIPVKTKNVETAQEEYDTAIKARDEAPKRTRAINKAVADAKKKLDKAEKDLDTAKALPAKIQKKLENEEQQLEVLRSKKATEEEIASHPQKLSSEEEESSDQELSE